MVKIRIEISGYGAEVSIGEVTKEQMDFMLSNKKKNMGRYLKLEANQEYEMDWYDLSDVYHETSASMDNSGITVDVDGLTVLDGTLSELDLSYDGDELENGINVVFHDFEDEIQNDKIYLVSVSTEKGTFLEFETEDESFNVTKLEFDVHGLDDYGFENLLNVASYGGEEFEYSSDNDTKDFQQYFIVNGEIVKA